MKPDTYLNYSSLNSAQPLPSRSQWVTLEIHRLLLEQHPLFVPMLMRLSMSMFLIFYVPTLIVLVWFALSLGANFWLLRLTNLFGELLLARPNLMTPYMHVIARRYRKAWIVNTLIWGIAPFLYVYWLPYLNQLFCGIIFVSLSALALARTHMHRKLMRQVSAIFITSQFLALGLHFVLTEYNSRNIVYFAVYLAGFLFMASLLKFSGDRMNRSERHHLHAAYSNLLTIKKLNSYKYQLDEAMQLVWHDIRAPLSAILTLLSARLQPAELDAISLQERDKSIEKQVRSTLDLADNFVWLFRAESDKHCFIEVDLVQLIYENVACVWPLAQVKNIKLCFDFKDLASKEVATHGQTTLIETKSNEVENLWVKIEPRLMGRAIFNLIENAIKYSAEHTQVVITLRTKKLALMSKVAEISVTDQGQGILEDDIPEIFDTYSRFPTVDNDNNTSKPPYPHGHGLGLRLVKTVADMHKGVVTCVSFPNKGSIFTMNFPM